MLIGGAICLLFRHAYDEATQQRTKKYGAKVFYYSALVIDPYESIFSEEEAASALQPYDGLEWLRRDEIAGNVEVELGEYLGYLLVA